MEKEERIELNWFTKMIAPLIGLKVQESEVSSEGVILFKDEVMDCFVPAVLLNELPEKLLFETMIYEQEDGTEWIGGSGNGFGNERMVPAGPSKSRRSRNKTKSRWGN
ncbi:hypothetical protein CEF21_21115 [Bacillus sp. FJAT-42376]|uniref:hypothetical protein n=1 Tax=Bacillus sp. FJAT-42376 TaxID=2014076 RepID=UPI000F5012EB|nr:hypothetical protein [Bacillus sp. FJAT-42376]AZB44584.1 hypothetical protein CEF21_21115 [Bacillus sp. FJAT-42376]